MKYVLTILFLLASTTHALSAERPRRLMTLSDIRDGRETLPISGDDLARLYEFDCPLGGSIEVINGEDTIEVLCDTELNAPETDRPVQLNCSWKDEFRLQALLLGGGWVDEGFLTSAQLAFSWFPGGGTHGLRLFGGAGYSFAPFHFLYGLAYQYQPKDKSWTFAAGVDSQNLKGDDYRLNFTGLAGEVDVQLKLTDTFSLALQAHFGVAWDEKGEASAFIAPLVGLGINGW